MQNYQKQSSHQFQLQQNHQQQKTSYQGRKRCFGEFKCPNCQKTWKSANSRSNEPQPCTNCRIQVYPLKQKSLESLFDGLRREKNARTALIEIASRQSQSRAVNHHHQDYQPFGYQIETSAMTLNSRSTIPSSFSHIWTD